MFTTSFILKKNKQVTLILLQGQLKQNPRKAQALFMSEKVLLSKDIFHGAPVTLA